MLQQPYTLAALTHMLEALKSILSPLEYICSRIMPSAHSTKPPLVTYIDQLSIFIAELLQGATPDTIPSYVGDAHAPPPEKQHTDLLAFCRRGLEDGLKTNWSESAGSIWFGQGHARREVLFDIGSMEEERARLEGGIGTLQAAIHDIYGLGDVQYRHTIQECSIGCDMVV